MSQDTKNAEIAAEIALDKLFKCIDEKKHFRFEAGAGAGKTFSLVKALNYIIGKYGNILLRNGQKIACITYTNIASDEITLRTESHPVIHSSTIHSFCWTLIKNFQLFLKEKIFEIKKWNERLDGIEDLKKYSINYKNGFPEVNSDEYEIVIGHDDVISFMVLILEEPKFLQILKSKFPLIFIDEYQDTDSALAESIKTNLISKNKYSIIGLFGDSWQKIYNNGCGIIEHKNLTNIDKEANFRSSQPIINLLNNIRTELPQYGNNHKKKGEISVFHTNDWVGARRPKSRGGHWEGDLPEKEAHEFLLKTISILEKEGWDFSPHKTKILMLTHNIMASELEYSNIAKIFQYNDDFIKKENSYIKFFIDIIEVISKNYIDKKYGEMFSIIPKEKMKIQTNQDKKEWIEFMDKLIIYRKEKNIGEILEFILKNNKLEVPESIKEKEKKLSNSSEEKIINSSMLLDIVNLKQVSYKEITNLSKFINKNTPFSTKHGVKGTEYENVLVVLGRGWNQYNWDEFLSYVANGVPSNKENFYIKNRNLFYVCCSRAINNLSLLFTQELSNDSMKIISTWFGEDRIISII